MSNRSSRVTAPPTARELIHSQLQQKSATRLVNSPHAKYNSRGLLMCIVCGCPVKSAIVWLAHVAKKSHIENLQTITQRQQQLNRLNESVKRKAAFTPASSNERKKRHIATAPTAATYKPKGILKGIIKSYESSDSDEEAQQNEQAEGERKTDVLLSSNTDVKQEINDPPDAKQEDGGGEEDFPEDMDVKKEQIEDPTAYYLTEADKAKPAAPPKPNSTEELPEGFFDDPKADAKARKVEYVNKDEAEWSAFMREVSVAETASRQIIADDTEEAAKRRQMQQAEEQMALYQRVLHFDRGQHLKQEQKNLQMAAPANNTGTPMDEDSSDGEDDQQAGDLAFNWRSKNTCI